MLARILLTGLFVEFAVYAALLMYCLPQIARAWILPLAIAFYCLSRLLLVLVTFAVAQRHRAGVPTRYRIGIAGGLKLVGMEWLSTIACYLLLMPLAKLFAPSATLRSAGRPVVLLLHGYLENGAVWWAMRRRLERNGCAVVTHTYEPPYAAIDEFVEGLHGEIESIRASLGVEQVVVLAHSMGGLLARAYFRRHGPNAVGRLITLGTPHQGTPLAVFCVGENARQMRPGSPWLTELAAHEDHSVLPPITAIYGHHDELVVPQTAAMHPRAENVGVGGIGHQTLPFSDLVGTMVLGEIRRGNLSGSAQVRATIDTSRSMEIS